MSNTIPSDDQILAAYSHLCTLADEWAFSKQTVFRLPELIEEMRDSAKWYDFKVLSLRDHKTPGAEIPAIFVRRVLRRSEEDESLRQSPIHKGANAYFPSTTPPLLYQWTNGQHISEFVVSLRGRGTTNPCVDAMEALGTLDEMRVKACEFLSGLDSDGRVMLTTLIEEAFEPARRSEATPHHLKDPITANRLKNWIVAPESPCGRSVVELIGDTEYAGLVFQHISDLYNLFARIKHAGYVEWSLSRVHFSADDGHAQSTLLGYCLETNGIEILHLSAIYANDAEERMNFADALGAQKHPWFPASEELALFQSAVKALYEGIFFVFNEKPKENGHWHQFVLPVYAHDHIDIKTDVGSGRREHQLNASGAFLGWLILNIESSQLSLLVDEEKAAASKRDFLELYEELLDLRYLLNTFADKYLAGEMQWALDDESVGLASPVEAVMQGMHHCSGWEGVKNEVLPEPPEFGFFQFLASSNRDALLTKCDAVTPLELGQRFRGSDIQYFRVLLTEDGAPPWSVLTLRKHPTTLIPEEWRRLRAYGQAVAQRVRDFHSKASLIAERRRSGTIEGQKTEWETLGHEMKHVAAALSGRWFVSPGSGGDIPGHAIAPVPELIAGAGGMIYLWCPGGDVREWIPNWQRTMPLLPQALERIWCITLYGILAGLAKTQRLDNPSSLKEVSAVVAKAKDVWQFSEWWQINADANALNNPQSLFLYKILRAFSIVSNNLIRHAKIEDSGRKCKFTVDQSQNIHITTDTASELRDEDGDYSNSLSDLFPSLNNARCGMGNTKSQGLGEDILDSIIRRELGGINKKTPGERHSRQIFIPAEVLQK